MKIILSTQFLDLLYSSTIKVLWCLQKKKQNKSRKKIKNPDIDHTVITNILLTSRK